MFRPQTNYFYTEGHMIRSSTKFKIVGLIVALGIPIVVSPPVFAAGGDISQVENFIRSVITTIAGLAGLIATGFLVYGGLIYITSSGNPERLDGAGEGEMRELVEEQEDEMAAVADRLLAQVRRSAIHQAGLVR